MSFNRFDVSPLREMVSINANGEAFFYQEFPAGSKSTIYRTPEQKKQWKLSRIKRELQNGAGYMYVMKKDKLKFFTFTLTARLYKNLLPIKGMPPGTTEKQKSTLLSVGQNFSKLLTGLRNQESLELSSYVWVREFTKKGTPHFHVIFSMNKVDPVKLSLQWSQLNGFSSKNSIDVEYISRGGYKAVVNYIAKYMTKESYKAPGRSFAFSNDLAQARKPCILPANEITLKNRGRVKQLNAYVSAYQGEEIAEIHKDYLTFISKK